MEENKEIDFIASRYQRGRFDTEAALRRIKPTRGFRLSIVKTVAASAFIAVVGATAAVLIHNNYFTSSSESVQQNIPASADPAIMVKVIDFEDTPLPMVVERIKEVYGVEITGLPENAETYKLSLHYEGTPDDLLETINDILGTDIRMAYPAENK